MRKATHEASRLQMIFSKVSARKVDQQEVSIKKTQKKEAFFSTMHFLGQFRNRVEKISSGFLLHYYFLSFLTSFSEGDVMTNA